MANTEHGNNVSVEWLAGFFEGEGSIGGTVESQDFSCGVPRTDLVVKVSTTHEEEVQQFKDYFDAGNVWVDADKRGNREDCYAWQCYGQEAKSVLSELLPALISVKKKQAEIAIEYLQVVEECGNPVKESKAIERLELIEELQSLTQNYTRNEDRPVVADRGSENTCDPEENVNAEQ